MDRSTEEYPRAHDKSDGSTSGPDRILFICFVVLSILFLTASIYLASVNNSPGLPDSENNLDTARNILNGKGFTTNIIQQLFEKLSLPGPEAHRPPGIPYLLAFLFKIFGISLAIPVLLNAIAILGSAWIMRSTVMLKTNSWFGSLAGIFMLLSSNYVLVWILNNNFLVLLTVILLYLIIYDNEYGIGKTQLVLSLFLIGAVGIYLKPTFMVTIIPLALYFLYSQTDRDEKIHFVKKILPFAIFLVLLFLATLPYWIFNMVNFGKPLYSPLVSLRLVERYGGFPQDTWWLYRIGNTPTYSELIEIYGIKGLIIREMQIWFRAAIAVVKLNPMLLLIVLGAFALFKRKLWYGFFIPIILLVVEPIFSSFFYWRGEDRYSWPLYPVIIFLALFFIHEFQNNRLPKLPKVNPVTINRIITILLVVAVTFGAYRTHRPWKSTFEAAHTKDPSWIGAVLKIEPDAVILTDNPWSVAWYSSHPSVICPAGERSDLYEVIGIYNAKYYLHTGRGYSYSEGKGQVGFTENDLQLLSEDSSEKHTWRLYRIK